MEKQKYILIKEEKILESHSTVGQKIVLIMVQESSMLQIWSLKARDKVMILAIYQN